MHLSLIWKKVILKKIKVFPEFRTSQKFLISLPEGARSPGCRFQLKSAQVFQFKSAQFYQS